MFGNLSKSLIKAPNYFNANVDSEPNQYSKIAQESLLDTYSNLRNINSRYPSSRYFRERDFIKKNLKLDLNYNNNARKEINPKVRTKHLMSFEEFMFGDLLSRNNQNNMTKRSLDKTINSNISNNTSRTNKSNFTKSVNSKMTQNSPKKTDYLNYIEKSLIPQETIKEFNGEVNDNVNNLIDRINKNSLNFKEFENKFEKNDLNGKSRIEKLREYINKDTVVEAPVKLKFPQIYIKSQDTLYREAMDDKINSLTILNPKIKEQLKTKKRTFASEKEFYRYNNSYYMNQRNPFNETIKYMENMKEKETI